MGDFADLASECGSDKVAFAEIYETYLATLRDRPIKLFEIGVGGYDDPTAGGASVRMWKRYLPRAEIYALDFYDKSAHSEPRITIFRGSQDDAGLLNTIADRIDGIDVIVDDGSHVSAHVVRSFEVLFPRLKPGGLYVIEDLGTSYWPEFGGSLDLANPYTSVNYLKRLVDGINARCIRTPYEASYADQHIEFLHFYFNQVVIKKKGEPAVPTPGFASLDAAARDTAVRDAEELRARLSRAEAERDRLAESAQRWFEAVVAVTAEHNPFPSARRKFPSLARRHRTANGARLSRRALAQRARAAAEWELAVRYYRDALDERADDSALWAHLGEALKEAGKAPEAELAYLRSRELAAGTRG